MKSLKTRLERMGCGWWLLIAAALLANSSNLSAQAAQAASPWGQPAAQLAAQVAEMLGAGQAQLTVNNRSAIAAQELPAIRRLLEQDLRARGVVASGAESANIIRVTLSENAHEGLWVAEVIEGNRTQVAMVHVDRAPVAAPHAESGVVLEKKRIWNSLQAIPAASQAFDEPVLAALETKAGLVVLEEEDIVVFAMNAADRQEEKRFPLGRLRPASRDARGMLLLAADGLAFMAYAAGTECSGSYVPAADNSGRDGDWAVHCRESDDPWPVVQGPATAGSTQVHAFYNASRDFFTGVITPNQGAELMPFYNLAVLPRAAAGGPALLTNGIDGKVRMAEGNALKAVTGTRDWGSDFAVLASACGAGTQIVTSGSGEAQSDSLRAYELLAQEAVAVSASLEMGGTVTALSTAPDGTSVWAVVRKGAREYEVDRVTALCP
jgi:hypothetical protein